MTNFIAVCFKEMLVSAP